MENQRIRLVMTRDGNWSSGGNFERFNVFDPILSRWINYKFTINFDRNRRGIDVSPCKLRFSGKIFRVRRENIAGNIVWNIFFYCEWSNRILGQCSVNSWHFFRKAPKVFQLLEKTVFLDAHLLFGLERLVDYDWKRYLETRARELYLKFRRHKCNELLFPRNCVYKRNFGETVWLSREINQKFDKHDSER